MKYQLRIFLFLLSSVFLLTVVSCDQNTSPADVFGDVIIKTENGFKFQNIDWMSKQAAIKEKVPKSSYNAELSRLETQNKYEDEERKALYYLQEDQFYSGEYIIVFNTKSDYELYLSEIKEQAKEFFKDQQPMSNSLDDLSDGQEVAWEGKDKSYFRIRCFEQVEKYTISFIVEAPKDMEFGA